MRELSIRGRTFPSDLNHNGNAFGGWIMSKMDKAASIAVERVIFCDAVTVFVTDMHFKHPVNNGDVFSVYTEVVSIGNTSIKVHVDFMITLKETLKDVSVTHADFTFVALDKKRNPMKIRNVLRDELSEHINKLLDTK